MNRIIVGFSTALLLAAAGLAVAQEKPEGTPATATKVTAVTVYEDRALVTRTAEAAVPAGASTVRLGDFPAGLDESSLRAMVEGEGVKVVTVTSRTEEKAEATTEAVRTAQGAVDELERDRLDLAAQLDALAKTEAELAQMESLARTAISERITLGQTDAEAFGKAAEMFPARRAKIADERRQINVKVDALDEQLKDARANLEKVSAAQNKTLRFVEVALDAAAVIPAQAGTAAVKLNVSYIIRNCGWSPRYEARLAGKSLNVAYLGEVRQKTGEDWKGVAMALSTARPVLGAKRPDLARIQASSTVVEKPKGRVVSGTAAPTPEMPPAVAPGESESSSGSVEAVAEDTGLSVLFQVAGVADVPSDGRAHKVPVTNFKDEKPDLAWETVPKLVRSVYLRCDSKNATAFPMLAGPVDIWRESGFIGTSGLKFTAPGGKLALSLGVDENLKVRRVRTLDKSDESGMFAKSRLRTVGWQVEVSNYHETPMTVRVRENYPVSDLEEVSVALLGDTTPPTTRDEKQGLLTWDIEIPAGEKKTVEMRYRVTMPKDFAWNE